MRKCIHARVCVYVKICVRACLRVREYGFMYPCGGIYWHIYKTHVNIGTHVCIYRLMSICKRKFLSKY